MLLGEDTPGPYDLRYVRSHSESIDGMGDVCETISPEVLTSDPGGGYGKPCCFSLVCNCLVTRSLIFSCSPCKSCSFAFIS